MKLYGYDIDAHHAEIARVKNNEVRGGSSKPKGVLPPAQISTPTPEANAKKAGSQPPKA